MVHHTDASLPPLVTMTHAEQMIRAGGQTSPVPIDSQAIAIGGPSLAPSLAGGNKDSKHIDILTLQPQKVPPLHKHHLKSGISDPHSKQTKPQPKRQLIPQFAQLIRDTM